jgi:hypothetical protein
MQTTVGVRGTAPQRPAQQPRQLQEDCAWHREPSTIQRDCPVGKRDEKSPRDAASGNKPYQVIRVCLSGMLGVRALRNTHRPPVVPLAGVHSYGKDG